METERTLYHYTTAEGLHSMLRSGHLWASDAAYMNDPKELRYGFDLLNEVVSANLHGRHKALGKTVQTLIDSVVEEKSADARVYVASFCGSGDLLSQWRGYGSFGGGFALGLLAECLLGPDPNEREPARVLQPVLYDPSRQKRILKRWVRKNLLQGPVSSFPFSSPRQRRPRLP